MIVFFQYFLQIKMHADSFICEIIGCLFNCHLQLSSCLWVWGAFACTMYKYASWRGKHALCWIFIIIIIWLNKHGTEDCSIIWVPWSVWITLKLIRRWSLKKKKKGSKEIVSQTTKKSYWHVIYELIIEGDPPRQLINEFTGSDRHS